MSESKGETLSTSAAVSPTPTNDANQQWAKFYIQACALVTTTKEKLDGSNGGIESTTNEEMMKIHQRIMITLDTITKLIFGLGATKKAKVVVHGGGAIELIVALVRTSKVLTDTALTPLS